MSSIALSTTATTSSASTETDLARKAARGDRAAFDELFARHSEPGWRLAQAVAADRDGAVDSFRDGFVRAVKGRRRSQGTPRRGARAGSATLRDDILAAVYGAASASSYDPSATPAAGLHRPAGGPDAALADAAFRSLPERWRAAVWLGEVEGFATERTAGVMGVSAAVAAQLQSRGAKGLAGRFVQSHREPPAELGPVLRALAIPAPADLAAATLAGWASTAPARRPLFAPASAWLHDSGFRPLLVAVGGLLAFGLIGMGVIPENTTVNGQLSATGNGPVSGAVPVTTCDELTCIVGTAHAAGIAPGATAAFGTTNPTLTGAFTSSAGAGGASGAGFAGGAGGSGSGGAVGIPSTRTGSGSGGGSGASGGGSKSSGSPSKPGGSSSKPTSSTTTAPTTTPTTQPPNPLNNVSSAVTTLSHTVTSAVGGVGSTVKQLPTNPAGAVSNLANTAGGAVSGVGGTVNALVGGTTTTTAPKAATAAPQTTTTTTCTVNLLGICVGV